MKTSMPPDFPFQLTNLLFLLPPILKAIYDVYFKEKRGIGVDHSQSLSYAIFFGFIISLIDFRISPVHQLWQSCFLEVAYFWLIFDYLRNLLAGKAIFYVDSNPSSDPEEDSWFDVHIYSKLDPLSMLFFKCWFMLTAISCYYFMSYITGESLPVLHN